MRGRRRNFGGGRRSSNHRPNANRTNPNERKFDRSKRENEKSQTKAQWRCHDCGEINGGESKSCVCGITKPRPRVVKSDDIESTAMVGDWRCTECKQRNPELQSNCKKCGMAKESGVAMWSETQFIIDFDDSLDVPIVTEKKKRRNPRNQRQASDQTQTQMGEEEKKSVDDSNDDDTVSQPSSHSAAKRVRRDAKPDWICPNPECKHVNRGTRKKCAGQCSMMRDALERTFGTIEEATADAEVESTTSSRRGSGRRNSKAQKLDWICPNPECKRVNRGARKKCSGQCKRMRDELEEAFGVAQEMEHDPNAAPQPKLAKKVAAPKPDWICPNPECKRVNRGARKKCSGQCKMMRDALQTQFGAITEVESDPTPNPASSSSDRNAAPVQDWICPDPLCGHVNGSRRQKCQCKQMRSDLEQKHGAAATIAPNVQLPKHPTQDWKCTGCGYANFKSRNTCRQCGSTYLAPNAQPSAAPATAPMRDWPCPRCTYVNFKNNAHCRQCNTPCPTATPTVRRPQRLPSETKTEEKVDDDAPPMAISDEIVFENGETKTQFAEGSFARICAGGKVKDVELARESAKFALKITYFLEPSLGIGEAIFLGREAAEGAKAAIVGWNRALRIVGPEQFGTDEDSWRLKLYNFSVNLDSETLTQELANLKVTDFREAKVFREGRKKSGKSNDGVENKLQRLFKDCNVESIKMGEPRRGTAFAILTFGNIIDCLKAKTVATKIHALSAISCNVARVDLDLRSVQLISTAVWNVTRPEIEKLMWMVRTDRARFPFVKVFLFTKPSHSRIVICGSDSDAICLARALYNNLLLPCVLSFPNRAVTKAVYRFLKRDFAQQRCTLIQVSLPNNRIKIYSKEDTRQQLHAAIDRYQSSLATESIHSVAPPIIRHLLNDNPTLVKIELEKESNVYLDCDITSKTIHIVADSADKLADALQKLEKHYPTLREPLTNTDDTKTTESSNDETCGICFMEITDEERDEGGSATLSLCQHSFHCDCLQMQLQSASQKNGVRPVLCAQCGGDMSLEDMRNELQSVESFQDFLKLAAGDYLNKNAHIFKPCPTADCSQVYTTTASSTTVDAKEERKSDKDDSSAMTMAMDVFCCTECLKHYCLSCAENGTPAPFHYGMTCKEYGLSKNADESLKEFLKTYKATVDTKNCPVCGMLTDKFPNTCNHATCVSCKSHFCWKCLWVPENKSSGSAVYGHMSSTHSGWYGQ